MATFHSYSFQPLKLSGTSSRHISRYSLAHITHYKEKVTTFSKWPLQHTPKCLYPSSCMLFSLILTSFLSWHSDVISYISILSSPSFTLKQSSLRWPVSSTYRDSGDWVIWQQKWTFPSACLTLISTSSHTDSSFSMEQSMDMSITFCKFQPYQGPKKIWVLTQQRLMLHRRYGCMKYFETKNLLQVPNGVNPLRAIILQRLGGTEAQR